MSANFDTLQNFTTELNWTQKDVQPCSDIGFLNIEKLQTEKTLIITLILCALTWTGDVAALLLCVDWWLAWPAWSEQQWKSHSLDVGEPRVWLVTGWWSLALAKLPAHSTVWVCTVELSIELPCRDNWRGLGAPLIVMQSPGPRDPKKAPAPEAPDPDGCCPCCCFAPAAVSLSVFITVTSGVGWPPEPVFLKAPASLLTLSPDSPLLLLVYPLSKLVCTCMLVWPLVPGAGAAPLPLAELRELSRLRQGVELTEPRPLAPDLPCTPSSLGPPWAMVEHVEDCREVTRDTEELPPVPAPGPTCKSDVSTNGQHGVIRGHLQWRRLTRRMLLLPVKNDCYFPFVIHNFPRWNLLL